MCVTQYAHSQITSLYFKSTSRFEKSSQLHTSYISRYYKETARQNSDLARQKFSFDTILVNYCILGVSIYCTARPFNRECNWQELGFSLKTEIAQVLRVLWQIAGDRFASAELTSCLICTPCITFSRYNENSFVDYTDDLLHQGT